MRSIVIFSCEIEWKTPNHLWNWHWHDHVNCWCHVFVQKHCTLYIDTRILTHMALSLWGRGLYIDIDVQDYELDFSTKWFIFNDIQDYEWDFFGKLFPGIWRLNPFASGTLWTPFSVYLWLTILTKADLWRKKWKLVYLGDFGQVWNKDLPNTSLTKAAIMKEKWKLSYFDNFCWVFSVQPIAWFREIKIKHEFREDELSWPSIKVGILS